MALLSFLWKRYPQAGFNLLSTTYMLIFRDELSLFPVFFWSAELKKLREELEGKAAFPLLPEEWVRNESSEIKSLSLDKEFWLKKVHRE